MQYVIIAIFWGFSMIIAGGNADRHAKAEAKAKAQLVRCQAKEGK